MTSPRSRILVAVRRFASSDESKLSLVEDFAGALDADVLLLHVAPAGTPSPSREAFARAYLDTLAARLLTRGVHAEIVIRTGPVASTILEEARCKPVKLIVLGASRRSAVVRAVVGSTADRVIGAAVCPVVLVQRSPTTVESTHGSFVTATRRAGPLTRQPRRSETVEVARIVGTVDRADELAADFRPQLSARRPADDQRFERILQAMEQGDGSPAIELYQLGFGYYVLDGHHRVAAARQLGQLEMEANVVEFVPTAAVDHAAARLGGRVSGSSPLR